MGNKLTPELQKQIIKEANSSAAKFHYYPGSEQFEDMGSAYESGAFKYAEKWQEEKALRERYEKALKDIENTASMDGYVLKKIANKALTPKPTTDDTDNR